LDEAIVKMYKRGVGQKASQLRLFRRSPKEDGVAFTFSFDETHLVSFYSFTVKGVILK